MKASTNYNLRSPLRPADGRDLRIRGLEAKLGRMESAMVFSLTTLLDLRDMDTGEHATRLAEWAMRVGELLGSDETELRDIEIASLLHDVGKVGVPDAILNKPGKLTAQEYSLVKKHPEYGWAALRLIPGFERASLFVLHHHERIDGDGYPGGLKGGAIPIGARIVCVVDAFDAMITTRPYRKGLPFAEAMRRLRVDSGTQFDSEVVELFTRIVVTSDLGQSEVERDAAAALSL